MKNLGFLRFTSALAVLAIVFASCSKDSLSKPQSTVSRHVTSNFKTNDMTPGTGGIQAIVTAGDLTVSMTVFNATYTSTETFAKPSNGFVQILDIPEGIYTVVFHAYVDDTWDHDLQDIVVENVKVLDGQITDLGTFSFL